MNGTKCWLRATGNTTRASRWTLFRARLCGTRVTGLDGDGAKMRGRLWRGRVYMEDFELREDGRASVE